MKMPLFRSTAAAAIAALLTGDFALLGIAFNDDGKAVILTPPLLPPPRGGAVRILPVLPISNSNGQ